MESTYDLAKHIVNSHKWLVYSSSTFALTIIAAIFPKILSGDET